MKRLAFLAPLALVFLASGTAVAADDEAREAIRKDRLALAEPERPFARYFAFSHLARAGAKEDDLEALRRGLSLALNSLSWRKEIARPKAVGALACRIDLRDYDWTAETWRKLLARYPYGLVAEGESEPASVRADWFVAAAIRPPLYDELLALPKTAKELEALLGTGEKAESARLERSGEASHGRTVERRDTKHGAHWKTLDFLQDGKEPGGGEAIFSLRNGLQAYAIFDRNGARRPKAPVFLAWNKEAREGSVENLSAISCLACHAKGPRPCGDDMKPLVESDAKRHLAAVALAGEADLVALSLRHDEPVSARLAAAELGVAEEALSKLEAIQALYPLSRRRSVPRADFARSFAAAARTLGLGRCLDFQEGEPLVSPPPRPGLRRFETPVFDRILSLDVDASWSFASRGAETVVLSREDGVKARLFAEPSDAVDTDDAIAREDFPGLRLLDHADDPEPTIDRYYVVSHDGPTAETVALDFATLKGNRATPKRTRLYRVSCEVPRKIFKQVDPELRRFFKHARISPGADASPDDPWVTPLPPALAEAGFETDWDKALARAKQEGKVVVCFVKPCAYWFT